MSAGAGQSPSALRRSLQIWILVAAVVLWLAALVPPLATWAERYQCLAAAQLALLAVVVPGLATIGSPWPRLGLAAQPGRSPSSQPLGPADRLAEARRRHRQLARALGFIGVDVAAIVAWMTPPAVGAVAGHRWLVLVEAATLLGLGIGLWLELVESPPLLPRSGPLRRAVLAAAVLWTFWAAAYVIGLSNKTWYPSFHHVAGHGLSAAADQQIAVAVLWLAAAVMFVPVVFWNALRWIRDEADPDAELDRLARTVRQGQWPGEAGRPVR